MTFLSEFKAEFTDVHKILIIKLRHIGDVLLTTPAIRMLKDAFPAACITALVNSGTEDALLGNPCVDEIMALDRSAFKRPLVERMRYELSFVKKMRRAGFDMVVDFTGGDRAAWYTLLSGAERRIGCEPNAGFAGKRFFYTHRVAVDRGKHTALQNLELLNKAGIETGDCRGGACPRPLTIDFSIPEQDEEWSKDILREKGVREQDIIVHIHTTSRWLFKCWKDEAMAAVIDRIQEEYGAKVVVTCSPDKREMEKANRIIGLAKNKPIAFIGDISLKKLGAISKRARLFFGVDSAPMHIAAAGDTPVAALFGPSGAFHWGPWDNDYKGQGARGKGQENPYSRRNGIQVFGKHTVIQRDWECIPCGKDGCDGSKISDCLYDIGVDEVMDVIGRYFED